MKYLIILVLLTGCYSKEAKLTGKEGKSLPSFKILTADSTWVNSTDITTGKPTILFLFGPQCPYSKAQMQAIIDSEEELKDMHVLAITPYSFSQMKRFYASLNINKYPNITVGMDSINYFGNYISASAVPYITVFNKENKLVKAYMGVTSISLLKKAALN